MSLPHYLRNKPRKRRHKNGKDGSLASQYLTLAILGDTSAHLTKNGSHHGKSDPRLLARSSRCTSAGPIRGQDPITAHLGR